MLDSLSFYAIRSQVGGVPIVNFDDAVDPEKLTTASDTAEFATPAGVTPEFSAKVYIWAGTPKPPAWLAFVEDGFDESFTIPDSAQSKALLIVRVSFHGQRFYAIPFGSGRFQLKRNATEQGYGLRVALNALYEGDNKATDLGAANRVRQVESKTVSANTMRTIRQTNRRTDFEDFELDPASDQLGGVTGRPLNEKLARRIRGTDSVRLARRTDFTDLGTLCRSIASYHRRNDYQRRFKFVDNFAIVTDQNLVQALRSAACGDVVTNPETWQFSPPGIQDYDDVVSYRITIPGEPELTFLEPEISDITANLPAVDAAKAIADTTVDSLDGNGDVIDHWPLLRGIDGQIAPDMTTYLLEEGDFYEVNADYLAELDAAIAAIPESTVELPPSVRVRKNGELKEVDEGTYNEEASKPANHFLLDKATVKVSSKTSAIEVCDVLTNKRQLIHVKRKFGSSSLSHLFGQGYVSSELLLDSKEYRIAIRKKIGSDAPAFRDLFKEDEAVAANWEVVYAIVGKWDAAKPVDKLPFFSKVNLRKHATALRRLGFKVTYARVEVVDP